MLACRVRVSRHWGLAALFEGELARTSLDASHGGAAGSPRAPAALSRIASSSRYGRLGGGVVTLGGRLRFVLGVFIMRDAQCVGSSSRMNPLPPRR